MRDECSDLILRSGVFAASRRMASQAHGSRRAKTRSSPSGPANPARDRKAIMSISPFLGIISGQRRRDHGEVADRVDRIAGGLHQLGVKPGDSVCMLMRNDIAFIEAAYAAMRLGAYGVPVNWHFKPEEINYVLKDSGTSVLIGHADMLHQLRDAIPAGITVLSAPTPPEILANYKIDFNH